MAAKAAPDGYTWIMANAGSHGINAAVYANLPFDIERDFAPITQIMRTPNVLVVSPSLGVGTVAPFIDLLKKNPGKYTPALTDLIAGRFAMFLGNRRR